MGWGVPQRARRKQGQRWWASGHLGQREVYLVRSWGEVSDGDLVCHFPSEAQFLNLQMGSLGEWFIYDSRSCFGISMPRDAYSPRPQGWWGHLTEAYRTGGVRTLGFQIQLRYCSVCLWVSYIISLDLNHSSMMTPALPSSPLPHDKRRGGQ